MDMITSVEIEDRKAVSNRQARKMLKSFLAAQQQQVVTEAEETPGATLDHDIVFQVEQLVASLSTKKNQSS